MTMLCCHKLKHHGPILQAQAQVRCNRLAIGVLLVARHCSTGIGGVGWQLGQRPALLRLVFQRVLQPQSNALTMSGDNGQGQCNYLWSMELIDQLDVLNSTSINPYLDCHWDAGSVQPSRAGTGMATHGQYLSRGRTAKQAWYWDGDPRPVLAKAPYSQAGLVHGMATHGQYLSRLRTAKQGWYWDGDPRPVLVEAPYSQAGLVLGWRPTASTCQGSVQPRAGTGMATHGQYLSRLRTAKQGWYWDGDPWPVLVEAPYSQAGLVLGWRPTASTCRGSVQPSRAGTGMATHGQYLSRLRTAKQGWYWDGDPRPVLVEAPYDQAGLVLGWRPTASTCQGSVQPRAGTGMATHGQYLSRLRTAKGWYWDGDPWPVLVKAPYSQGLVLGWRPTASTCQGSVQPSRAGTGMATHGQYLSRLRTAKGWYWDGDPRPVLVKAPYSQGLVLGWRPTASTCQGSVEPRAGTGMATHGQYLSRLRTAKQGWYWDGDPWPVLVKAPYSQAGLVLGWRPTASTCQGSVQPSRAGTVMATHGQYLLVEGPYSQAGLVLGWRPTASRPTCQGSVQPSRAGTGMATHGQYLSRLRTAKQGWYWDGDPRPVLVEAPYSQAGLVLGWRPTASTCRGSVQPSRAGTGMATHGQYLPRLRTAKGWYWDGDPRPVLVKAPYSQGLVLGWRPTASTCRGSVQPSRAGTGMATHGQYLSRLRTAKGWYWDGDPRPVLVEAPYSQAGLVLGWRPTASTCRGSVQPSRAGTGMATHGQYLSRGRTAKQGWYWDGDPRPVLVKAPYDQAGLVL